MTCSLLKDDPAPLISGLTVLARIIARDMIAQEVSKEMEKIETQEAEQCKI